MQKNHFIPDMYRTIDSMDTNGLVNLMTEDAIFRFANLPAVEGKQNIAAFLRGFFQSIKAISHSALEYWNTGNVWFVSGQVSYTRLDNSVLQVPFAVLLKMEAEFIKEFLIFVDNSALYN
jgi:ketosteroid isomerase-like protein